MVIKSVNAETSLKLNVLDRLKTEQMVYVQCKLSLDGAYVSSPLDSLALVVDKLSALCA